MFRRGAAKTESAEEQHRRGTIPTARPVRKCLAQDETRNPSPVSQDGQTSKSEERAARNEVFFREANERLGAKRVELGAGGRTPFLCECSDPECTELIHLTLEEYEHVRAHPTWFVAVTGHDAKLGTVEAHEDYAIVAKSGVAGVIATDQDPRR
jgi:hypothetical protein